MSFQDELNKESKTPQELDDDLRKSMDTWVRFEYEHIKKCMISAVQQCKYTIVGNKKQVTIYHDSYLYHDLDHFAREEKVYIKQPSGFLGMKTKTIAKRKIVFDQSRYKDYEIFMSCIRKYASEDNMEISYVAYFHYEGDDYEIPTSIIDSNHTFYKLCLKCTMIY